MIPLTRLNGQLFYLNERLIERVEGTPDTVITLTSGEVYRIQEEVETVVELIRAYQRSLYQS